MNTVDYLTQAWKREIAKKPRDQRQADSIRRALNRVVYNGNEPSYSEADFVEAVSKYEQGKATRVRTVINHGRRRG